MYEIIHGNVSKTLEKQNSHISFPIPAINGFFISHVYNGLPYLRTFLSVEELNPNQKELLELMSKIIPKYENLNLPYLLEERYLENDEVFVYFLLSAIFIEVGVIFKKIIPNSIEDKIPQGQKANMIKKLISLVENFPRKWQDVPIEKDDDQYKEFLEKLEQGNFSDYSKLKTKKMRQFMRSHK